MAWNPSFSLIIQSDLPFSTKATLNGASLLKTEERTLRTLLWSKIWWTYMSPRRVFSGMSNQVIFPLILNILINIFKPSQSSQHSGPRSVHEESDPSYSRMASGSRLQDRFQGRTNVRECALQILGFCSFHLFAFRAVIGIGSSGLQTVGAIAPFCKSVKVYARSKFWVRCLSLLILIFPRNLQLARN